ncbi:MAG TPA: amidohydrolase family protein [Xanthobacteraceae bacterium]
MSYVKSPQPDRNTRIPKIKLPPGACDTHFHIFGPQDRFPLSPGRRLEVEDCTIDDLISMHDTLGISRGLIVQSFQHGFSHEYLLHALCREPGRFRGCIIPAPDITDRELRILADAGVVAIRFGFKSAGSIDRRMLDRCRGFGMQPHYLVHGEPEIAAWRSDILATQGRFVLEHMGYPGVERGLDDPCFKFLLECLDSGRCWVKLSPRCSAQPTIPFDDVLPFVRTLVERAPERLLWGSDWPHPNYFNPMPNDADLLDLMLAWAPDAATQRRIMVDNPSELLGFN